MSLKIPSGYAAAFGLCGFSSAAFFTLPYLSPYVTLLCRFMTRSDFVGRLIFVFRACSRNAKAVMVQACVERVLSYGFKFFTTYTRFDFYAAEHAAHQSATHQNCENSRFPTPGGRVGLEAGRL